MNKVHPKDDELFKACRKRIDIKAFTRWANAWLTASNHTRKPDIEVDVWTGDFNERDERNACISMAEGMGADWIISVDHDETIENRVGRKHFDRLMSHPDPLVQSYNFAFLTHWDSNRLISLAPPWGDSGTYRGGMHGYRMFRVNKEAPRVILAGDDASGGLHCGNIPDFGMTARRIAGMRFRHFGYMRPEDRWRKEARYNQQDPNPNPTLIGGANYGHISHEENTVMSAYAPHNGIGLHMLLYEGEDYEDLGRWLNDLYAMVDRIVLVWTGEWTDHDKVAFEEAVGHGIGSGAAPTMVPAVDLWNEKVAANWPTTGPSHEMSKMAEHFGAEWIHTPLDDNYAAARNSGLEALHGTVDMSWALCIDPDEQLKDPFSNLIALRRMAEATDCWGWLVSFLNVYPDGGHNESEAVRMGRLDEDRIMRFSGRVHETYTVAQVKLVKMGFANVLRRAPFYILNTGLAGTPAEMEAKLSRYYRITLLELHENPYNSQAWVTLGLYWLNEKCPMVGMECFSRAVTCGGDAFMPYQEMALQYARLSRMFMGEAVSRMGNHRMKAVNEKIVSFLESAAPDLPPMGLIHSGEREPISEAEAMESLPPFAPPGIVEVPAPDVGDNGEGDGEYYPDDPEADQPPA